jgi:hypothetical protein
MPTHMRCLSRLYHACTDISGADRQPERLADGRAVGCSNHTTDPPTSRNPDGSANSAALTPANVKRAHPPADCLAHRGTLGPANGTPHTSVLPRPGPERLSAGD